MAEVEIGSREAPLKSVEPMKVARAAFEAMFVREGWPTLLEYRRDFWVWEGERWHVRDHRWLVDTCKKWLEDRFFEQLVKKGDNGKMEVEVRRFAPTKYKVEEMVWFLQSLVRIDDDSELPLWLGDKPLVRPGTAIAFDDVVVDARTQERIERDRRWFDCAVLPVRYEEGAKCERWRRCLDEWSRDDGEWVEALQRVFGYCLMSHRRYAKWVLMHGKIRGGKGTVVKVLKRLVGGKAFVGTTLEDLGGQFGLAPLRTAKVLTITEVSEMEGRVAERVARVIKNIVGEDPITIDRKYQEPLVNVTLRAVPIVLSNEIPTLPNKGRGLSSKMLMLPFDESFEGKEQFDLIDELEGEMAGIAAWALEGAQKLEGGGGRFPTPERSTRALEVYHSHNNPIDKFLKDRFVPSSKGTVSTSLIWKEWENWREENRVRRHIDKSQIKGLILRETTWLLEDHRVQKGGPRGIRGLAFRRVRNGEE